MLNLTFQCEFIDHKEQQNNVCYYYCSMCNIVICMNCMIKHLCVKLHTNPEALIPVQSAVEKTKSIAEQMEKKIKKGYEDISKVNGNEVDSIVVSKRKEINDHYEMLVTQLKNVKLAIDSIFEKQIAELNEGRAGLSGKKINPIITKEFNEIISEISKINNLINANSGNGNLLLKTSNDITKQVDTFMIKIEGEKKNDRNSMTYSRKLNSVKATLDNLDIGPLFSELKRYIDRNKITLNFQSTNSKENIERPPTIVQNVINKNNIIDSNNSSIPKRPKLQSILTQKDSDLYNQIQNINYNLKGNPQSSPQIRNDPNFVYPYKGIYIIHLKIPDGKSKSEILVYNPLARTSTPAELISKPKGITGLPEHFPYRNSKYTNIGDNTIIITGGYLEATMSNKVFKLKINNDLSAELTVLKSLKIARQSHNIIYLPEKNYIVVCGGQNLKASEYLNLSNPSNQWEDLPNLNKPRANATLFYLNNYLYCVGGYNHVTEKYQSGYEMLNMNDIAKGWKEIVSNELGMSTMGVVILNSNQVILMGGFKGGKKYLNDGVIITIDEKTREITNIEKKSNVLSKGGIFYCSQQFMQCDDSLLNIDFKGNVFVFNKDKLCATIEAVNNK